MTKTVRAILRYPIHGCAPERVITAMITDQGIDLDGRWAVVASDGSVVLRKKSHFWSIELQSIRNIAVTSKKDGVFVKAPDMRALFIPYPAIPEAERDALMPAWSGKGIEVSRECSLWFTEYLSGEREDCYRLVELSHEEKISFGGNPMLRVVSDQSLRAPALQQALEDECPNLILGNCSVSEVAGIDLALLGGILLRGHDAVASGRNFLLRGKGFVHEGARVEVLE